MKLTKNQTYKCELIISFDSQEEAEDFYIGLVDQSSTDNGNEPLKRLAGLMSDNNVFNSGLIDERRTRRILNEQVEDE